MTCQAGRDQFRSGSGFQGQVPGTSSMYYVGAGEEQGFSFFAQAQSGLPDAIEGGRKWAALLLEQQARLMGTTRPSGCRSGSHRWGVFVWGSGNLGGGSCRRVGWVKFQFQWGSPLYPEGRLSSRLFVHRLPCLSPRRRNGNRSGLFFDGVSSHLQTLARTRRGRLLLLGLRPVGLCRPVSCCVPSRLVSRRPRLVSSGSLPWPITRVVGKRDGD